MSCTKLPELLKIFIRKCHSALEGFDVTTVTDPSNESFSRCQGGIIEETIAIEGPVGVDADLQLLASESQSLNAVTQT